MRLTRMLLGGSTRSLRVRKLMEVASKAGSPPPAVFRPNRSPAGNDTWRGQTQGKDRRTCRRGRNHFRVALDRILRGPETFELEGRNGSCRSRGNGPRPRQAC